VLIFSIAFSTVLFTSAAVMGYKMFGESTESQFTLNLPQNLVVSKIAIWATVIALVYTILEAHFSVLSTLDRFCLILSHADFSLDFCCRWQIQLPNMR
jgi:amino acid permease